jgi:hypothetical protein
MTAGCEGIVVSHHPLTSEPVPKNHLILLHCCIKDIHTCFMRWSLTLDPSSHLKCNSTLSRRTYHCTIPIENIRLPVPICSSDCNLFWKTTLQQFWPIPAQRQRGKMQVTWSGWAITLVTGDSFSNPPINQGISHTHKRLEHTCRSLD